MGYDLGLFEGNEDEIVDDLICPICKGVLENPLYAPNCEHAFCEECISEWLNQHQNCPLDRQPLLLRDMKPIPRIMKNLLGKLRVKCENAEHGCEAIVRLDNLVEHSAQCEFNPKRPIPCESCEMEIPKNQIKNHNCIRDLRKQVLDLQTRVESLEKDKQEQNTRHNRDISRLARMIEQSSSHRSILQINNRLVEEQILRWSESLSSARVTRWGGVISTPDSVLQRIIRRSLDESGCPQHIVSDLIENAHERKWPGGLATLETRQLNRRYYDDYVTKRIPGKQAVVVLQCENGHMPTDMISDPGIVMIFAHGVEDV